MTITVQQAMDKFFAYLRVGTAPNTVRTYRTGLKHFGDFLEQAHVAPAAVALDALKPSFVPEYVQFLHTHLLDLSEGDDKKVSVQTKGVYFAALEAFLNYCVLETEYLTWSVNDFEKTRAILRKAARSKRERRIKEEKLPKVEFLQALLTEVHRPLALPAAMKEGERRRRELERLRNIALIEAMRASGMRVSEVLSLRRGDLVEEKAIGENGKPFVYRGARVSHTKENKDRTVLFDEAAWSAIHAYLRARKDGASGRALASLAIFSSHARRAGDGSDPKHPITSVAAERIVRGLAQRSGVLKRFHFTPHSFRHFFGYVLLAETHDLAMVQHALGHSDPKTTRIYAETLTEDYARTYHGLKTEGNSRIIGSIHEDGESGENKEEEL